MGSKFYGKRLPDYGDLDNRTATVPGYRLYVIENDGGVSLQVIHADDDPMTSAGYSVFLTPSEAEELVDGIRQAISQARAKNANHPSRGTDA